MTDIMILDACCGSRMFWFDKMRAIQPFMDIRKKSLKSMVKS